MTLPIPKMMHGHPVIKYRFTPKAPVTRAGYVILVERPPDRAHPFVTGWVGLDDSQEVLDREWCYGHYFTDKDDALSDFDERCRRGF